VQTQARRIPAEAEIKAEVLASLKKEEEGEAMAEEQIQQAQAQAE